MVGFGVLVAPLTPAPMSNNARRMRAFPQKPLGAVRPPRKLNFRDVNVPSLDGTVHVTCASNGSRLDGTARLQQDKSSNSHSTLAGLRAWQCRNAPQHDVGVKCLKRRHERLR